MARSNAERQAAWKKRRENELASLRQRVHDLEGERDAARARIDELECAESEAMRLTRTATAQAIVDRLAGGLSDARLAQVWVMLGERLKAATPRGQSEAAAPRRGRNLAQYLYPSIRRPQRET
jgi:hypothetical protein